MLPFRLILVTVAAGLCLWGLFSLLDNLQEPGLLRSVKATVVKGCDSLESSEALQLCPPLFCQKALLDARLLPLKARFDVSLNRGDENRQRVIGGTAYPGTTEDDARHFICVIAGAKAIEARLVDAEELDEMISPAGS